MLSVKRLIALLILPLIISGQVSFAQNCTVADKPQNEFCAQRDQIGYLEAQLLRILARDLTCFERSLAKRFDGQDWHFVAKFAGSQIVGKVAQSVLSLNDPMQIAVLHIAAYIAGGYLVGDKESSPLPLRTEIAQKISERQDQLLFTYSKSKQFSRVIFNRLARVATESAMRLKSFATVTLNVILLAGSAAGNAVLTTAPYITLSAMTVAVGFMGRAVYREIAAFQNLMGRHTVHNVFGWEEVACVVCFETFGEDNCFRLGLPCGHTQTCENCLASADLILCPVCRAPR